jgi:hypothetical protein
MSYTSNSYDAGRKAAWVKTSVDYKGRFRNGHVRKSASTSKNKIKNRKPSK